MITDHVVMALGGGTSKTINLVFPDSDSTARSTPDNVNNFGSPTVCWIFQRDTEGVFGRTACSFVAVHIGELCVQCIGL